MPIRELTIPFKKPMFEVSLAYLDKYDENQIEKNSSIVMFLHSVRSGTLKNLFGDAENNPWAKEYWDNLDEFKEDLANLIIQDKLDIIVSPPSDYEYSDPYRLTLKNKFPSAKDLTENFSRKQGIKSGTGTSLNKLIEAIKFKAINNLVDYKNVLIVDDILASGNTAAAIITLLRKNGLPESASISVACPLWVIPKGD